MEVRNCFPSSGPPTKPTSNSMPMRCMCGIADTMFMRRLFEFMSSGNVQLPMTVLVIIGGTVNLVYCQANGASSCVSLASSMVNHSYLGARVTASVLAFR